MFLDLYWPFYIFTIICCPLLFLREKELSDTLGTTPSTTTIDQGAVSDDLHCCFPGTRRTRVWTLSLEHDIILSLACCFGLFLKKNKVYGRYLYVLRARYSIDRRRKKKRHAGGVVLMDFWLSLSLFIPKGFFWPIPLLHTGKSRRTCCVYLWGWIRRSNTGAGVVTSRNYK